jgi:hypothetical protein
MAQGRGDEIAIGNLKVWGGRFEMLHDLGGELAADRIIARDGAIYVQEFQFVPHLQFVPAPYVR